jgi:FlaA1/EpsC-like NDP-sugar epimerase
VERIVALSTDKAANPVNLYGATKLCAEKLFIQGNAYAARTPVRFSCVRYGNVVASRGSVVPLFIEQRVNGSLSITDKRMTRFWITVLEAVSFVKEAVETMHGGELFVPKLPSVRITDLAEAVAPGVPVREIGIRPGEKLHETLVTAEETRHALAGNGLFLVLPEYMPELARPWSHLAPLTTDIPYSSDRNEWWFAADEIATRLPAALSEARAYESGVVIAREDTAEP